jgi:hypothetical protein
VADGWLDETLLLIQPQQSASFFDTKTAEPATEQDLLDNTVSTVMPTTFSKFKGHRLYCLEMHLTNTEALNPKGLAILLFFGNRLTSSIGPILGYCKGQPVYPRSCVKPLHTRDAWLKMARVVEADAEPVKKGVFFPQPLLFPLKYSEKQSHAKMATGCCSGSGKPCHTNHKLLLTAVSPKTRFPAKFLCFLKPVNLLPLQTARVCDVVPAGNDPCWLRAHDPRWAR